MLGEHSDKKYLKEYHIGKFFKEKIDLIPIISRSGNFVSFSTTDIKKIKKKI